MGDNKCDTEDLSQDLRKVIKAKRLKKEPDTVNDITEDNYPFMKGYTILESSKDLIWFKQGVAVPLPNLVIIKREDL